jgi:hypothetical protein
MTRYRITFALCAFCLTVAYGQSPQGPSDQVKRFTPYAGTFEGQLIMTQGGKTVTAKVKCPSRFTTRIPILSPGVRPAAGTL